MIVIYHYIYSFIFYVREDSLHLQARLIKTNSHMCIIKTKYLQRPTSQWGSISLISLPSTSLTSGTLFIFALSNSSSNRGSSSFSVATISWNNIISMNTLYRVNACRWVLLQIHDFGLCLYVESKKMQPIKCSVGNSLSTKVMVCSKSASTIPAHG